MIQSLKIPPILLLLLEYKSSSQCICECKAYITEKGAIKGIITHTLRECSLSKCMVFDCNFTENDHLTILPSNPGTHRYGIDTKKVLG
jgi:hypothetical protein